MISRRISLTQEHLTTKEVTLQSAETWSHEREGLFFLFVKAGVGKCLCGSATQFLAAGDVLAFNATSVSEVFTDDGVPLVFWYFSVCVEHLFPLFGGEEISVLHRVREGFKTCKLYPAASGLAMECHRLLDEAPVGVSLDHRAQLLRVVSCILSLEIKQAHADRCGHVGLEEHLAQVFSRLSVGEILTLSVRDLAERFNYTRRHLNRIFHRRFGLSVAKFRMDMRLVKAASLLRDPGLKVIDVAKECGFNHLGLFNTCFKRRFGSSPGQWRKTLDPGAASNSALDYDPSCRLMDFGLCPWFKEARQTVLAPEKGPDWLKGGRKVVAPADEPMVGGTEAPWSVHPGKAQRDWVHQKRRSSDS